MIHIPVSYSMFFLTIFTIAICVWLTVVNSFTLRAEALNDLLEREGELVFVHVIYRHGDRSPIAPSPGGQYNDISYWQDGWGQLTTLGMQQEYALGQWLRRRYSNFLSNTFNVNDIYIQSSDVDRTLMSAQSTLAGFYPPLGSKIWNRNVLWQPVPVHTMPVSMDYLIAGQVPSCPAYQNALNQYMASEEMQLFEKSTQPIYDYLTTETGSIINDMFVLMLIRDSWLCESIHNYTLPQWTKTLFPDNEDFERASMKMYYLFAGTKFLAKFMSGFLLKDILDRFSTKIDNSLSPNRKLWMYSTHDSTLFSFLQSLDISDNNFVPYAGTITLELRKFENEHYVQIFYKNSTKTPEPIMIPECGSACPLYKMYEIYDNILPKNNFDIECQIPV